MAELLILQALNAGASFLTQILQARQQGQAPDPSVLQGYKDSMDYLHQNRHAVEDRIQQELAAALQA